MNKEQIIRLACNYLPEPEVIDVIEDSVAQGIITRAEALTLADDMGVKVDITLRTTIEQLCQRLSDDDSIMDLIAAAFQLSYVTKREALALAQSNLLPAEAEAFALHLQTLRPI